jgi:hypothetical protein
MPSTTSPKPTLFQGIGNAAAFLGSNQKGSVILPILVGIFYHRRITLSFSIEPFLIMVDK